MGAKPEVEKAKPMKNTVAVNRLRRDLSQNHDVNLNSAWLVKLLAIKAFNLFFRMDHDLQSILSCINFEDDIESVNNSINEYIAQNMDGSLARLLEDPWEKHVFWKTIEWMLYDPRGDPDDEQDKF